VARLQIYQSGEIPIERFAMAPEAWYV